MKLPQDIEGIYREGRDDSFTCAAGVEPLWFRDKLKKGWNWAKRNKKKIRCAAMCANVPGWAGKGQCVADCMD